MDISILLMSLLITFGLLFALQPLAIKMGLTDQPSSRKTHSGEIPLIGGICIYLCLLILYYWLPIHNLAYLIAASLIVVCGIIDDYKDVSYKIRLIIEVLAVLIMITWGGVHIISLGNLLGFGEIQLGYFSYIFTAFAIVGGINAFNMIDGIDGLAGSLSLVAFFLIYAIAFNHSEIFTLCLVFIPAISAFLFFNLRLFGRKKASIFLGDTGSMLFGFTISCLIIRASQGENNTIPPVAVLWLIALPLFDSVSIMFRRLQKGRSPFEPDREHFHHILPLAGYSINQTVSIIVAISLTLSTLGLIGIKVLKFPEWLMFLLFLGFFALYYWGMSHAWMVMKIARYIREHKNDRRKKDRRVENVAYSGSERRVTQDRRSGIDRRYHAIERALSSEENRRESKKIKKAFESASRPNSKIKKTKSIFPK